MTGVAKAARSRRREHRGDFMKPEVRSALMSRIKGRDTGPERIVAGALTKAGIRFETQVRELPGRPDFLIRHERLVLFVDGDFWHGWRFPAWRHKLSKSWEAKIEANRQRDRRNFRKLRRMGWTVLRLWEHQVESNVEHCVARILNVVLTRKKRSEPRAS